MGFGTSGSFGKSSFLKPTTLNEERWYVTCTQLFSSARQRISPSGADRTISRKRSPGMAALPLVLTFARQVVRAPISRSVALIFSSNPSASRRKWERIGIEFRFSTALRTKFSSFKRSDFSAKKSIGHTSVSVFQITRHRLIWCLFSRVVNVREGACVDELRVSFLSSEDVPCG